MDQDVSVQFGKSHERFARMSMDVSLLKADIKHHRSMIFIGHATVAILLLVNCLVQVL